MPILSHQHVLMLQLHFFHLPLALVTLRLDMGASCLVAQADALDKEGVNGASVSVRHNRHEVTCKVTATAGLAHAKSLSAFTEERGLESLLEKWLLSILFLNLIFHSYSFSPFFFFNFFSFFY